ncbi:succinyl-CoA synthetase subunit alpha [Candidatus Micrarchaeota archaeon]|nr:succinyl-CoA synthetase subunit alpha [Candidatus Micrarchaeota archaeon]
MAGEYSFYLNSDFSQYAGQWIALVSRKVVAHDNNAKKAYCKARKEFPNKIPFLACVPRENIVL